MVQIYPIKSIESTTSICLEALGPSNFEVQDPGCEGETPSYEGPMSLWVVQIIWNYTMDRTHIHRGQHPLNWTRLKDLESSTIPGFPGHKPNPLRVPLRKTVHLLGTGCFSYSTLRVPLLQPLFFAVPTSLAPYARFAPKHRGTPRQRRQPRASRVDPAAARRFLVSSRTLRSWPPT